MEQQQIHKIKLSNGIEMPVFGLGTYKGITQGSAAKLIRDALDNGYRHIDTAVMYENEAIIGEALQEIYNEGKYTRSDIFLVSKLFSKQGVNVAETIAQSLKNLRTDYIDLYLLHYSASPPNPDFTFTHKPVHIVWKEMEQCCQSGIVKSIGVSNFNVQSLLDLLVYATIKPVVNQIEVNVYLQQPRLLEFCKLYNVHITAYSPLARCLQTNSDEVLQRIAAKYENTTIPQVMLSYLLSLGISVIPKTSNSSRLIENIQSFNLILQEEDKEAIRKLNKNLRIVEPYEREWWRNIPYFD